MPSTALLQFERRLTELACPPGQLRRKIRELGEHHEDLKRDALEEGLSETDAEARADELLGEPVALAEHLAAALRQSSWWGRHPFIGFCLLPPLAIIPLLVFVMWVEYWIGRVYFTDEQLGSLADWDNGLKYCRLTVFCTYYAAIVFAAIMFSNLARRTVAGFRWACIACLMCALHGAFCFISLVPHNFTVGYTNEMHWLGAVLPLFVAFVIWLNFRNAAGRLPPLPPRNRRIAVNAAVLPKIPKSGMVTPTSVIATLIIIAIIITVYRAHIPVTHRTMPPRTGKIPPAKSQNIAAPATSPSP